MARCNLTFAGVNSMCCEPPTVVDIFTMVVIRFVHRNATADTSARRLSRSSHPGSC